MSVLQRRELEESPLADLHAIASELGIEGYRTLPRGDLISAILAGQGPEPDAADGEDAAGLVENDEAAADGAAPDAAAPQTAEPEALDAEPVELADEEEPGVLAAGDADGEAKELAPPEADERAAEAPEELVPAAEPEAEPEAGPVSGTLDILPNGSGFIRVGAAPQSDDDVYISPAQIRRCELRAGDEVGGPVRSPRRNERHPSLVRVETVNGRDAEPPEERTRFADLTPVHPTERLETPARLAGVPFGKGSRVAIAGAPGAGATRLLQEIVRTLTGRHDDLQVLVALVGARPEEVTEWQRELDVPVAGGSFDSSPEAQTQAAELTVERAKRIVERGGDAVVVIDSLESVPPGAARRLFGAGRKAEEGGSLTVVAAIGGAAEPLRQASTRITLDAAADEPTVLGPRSGTQRADLLA